MSADYERLNLQMCSSALAFFASLDFLRPLIARFMATLTLSGFEDTALVEVCCTVACWTFSVLYLGDDLFDRFMFREVRLAFAGFEADISTASCFARLGWPSQAPMPPRS